MIVGGVVFIVAGIAAAIWGAHLGNPLVAALFGVMFPLAGVAFIVIGRMMRRQMRQVSAIAREAIAEAAPPPLTDGAKGVATIVWFESGTRRLTLGVERALEVALELDVAVDGKPPYRVKGLRVMFPEIRLGMLRPGERIAVVVDRADPNRVQLDWSGPPPPA